MRLLAALFLFAVPAVSGAAVIRPVPAEAVSIPLSPLVVSPVLSPSLSVLSVPSVFSVVQSVRLEAAASPFPAAALFDGQRPVPAASDGPVLPEPAAAAQPAPEKPRSANSFWSGFPPVDVEAVSATLGADADDDAGTAAPWLALKDRRHAAALDAAVALARATESGRRAFDGAEAALGNELLPVDVLDLGRNWGEYDYVEGRLRLHKRLFEPGREAELAGTLAHELTHVRQHAEGLPSNALELEIEAHLLDLKLMEELGLTPPPHTFARQLADALKKGPAAFIELIQAAVPGSPFLGEQKMAEILDQLEQDYDDMAGAKSARKQKLAAVIAADLKSLRSKKGAAAYRAFSARILKLLKERAEGVRL